MATQRRVEVEEADENERPASDSEAARVTEKEKEDGKVRESAQRL